MNENGKQRLLKLGADALAEALLDLASRNEAADDLVERMIATPKESHCRFKAKLAALKRSQRFVRWGESADLARELEALLDDLKAEVSDSRVALELLVAFYETDSAVFGRCDDSSGCVGGVFTYTAKEMFVTYARQCDDKDWLAQLALDLNRKDDYGVRDALIDCAAEYLPEPSIRLMISRFQDLAALENEEHKKRHWLLRIESLARQIKDAALFETARIASWGEFSPAACVDIAQVYLESGDARTALAWVEKAPKEDTFRADEKDQLLIKIYGCLGETEKQGEVSWRIFRRHYCAKSLDNLLAFIGRDKRDVVIAEEIAAILGKDRFSLSGVAFVVEIGHIDDAVNYLLEKADQINGDLYGSLLPIAKTMESEGRPLAATVIYRALLESILRRAQSKIYPHGVHYLKKLDRLADLIEEWRAFEDHAAYLAALRQQHRRKSSFWSQYK